MSFNWRQPAAATASSQQQACCVSVVLGFDLDLGLVLYVVREGHCRLCRHTCLSYWKLIFFTANSYLCSFLLIFIVLFWEELAENGIVLLILFFLKKYNHFRVVSLIIISACHGALHCLLVIFDALQIRALRERKLRQGRNVRRKWSGIRIWISGLILSRIRMFVGSLPKC